MAAIALRFSKSCCFAFNDKLAYFDLVCDKNAVNIVCKLYSFTIADNVCRIVEDRLEPSEINVARGLISPNHCEVSILAFKTVKFAETQLEFPVVLIKKEYFGPKKDIELMLVGLIASDCGLYLTSIGPLLKLETPCASGIFLSNGPSIFWMSQGELSVNLINLVKNTFTKWKFPISDAQIGCRIIDLGANFIWDEELRGCIAIVLWNESLARFLEITFSTTSNVVNIKRNKKFDEQSVAYRYLKVCTSACFQKVRDRCDTMNFFVTTSNKQMMSINFELMAIKFYTIPFDDSNSIQFYRNRHKLEDYCLLTSASGQSCIMDLDKSKVRNFISTTHHKKKGLIKGAELLSITIF